MHLSLIYWIIMLLWLISGLWVNRPASWAAGAPGLLQFVLFLLLGWKVFGAPVHG